jgi:3-hydroxybutyryl-CoA dehydrogenase
MAISKVGVIGCGLMGSGIAQVSAQAGFKTLVREVNAEALAKGLKSIETYFDKQIPKGKATEFQRRMVKDNLRGVVDLQDLRDCDLIIEAIPENLELKNRTWQELDAACPPSTIFATNTSSLKVMDQAVATKRPDRFVGLHFFNPVPVMKLVEVVRSEKTSTESFESAAHYVKMIDKTACACVDTTGFVVNRLLVPYMLDAIRALEQGIASAKDIDSAMVQGCGYPMGPFVLLDFVGLDTTLHIADIMTREFGKEQYNAPELLRKMVAEGKLGKKSGKGFYDYGK